MARAANPVAPVLSTTTPDRLTERMGVAEAAIDAVEVVTTAVADVGADGTLLTSTGTTFGWEAPAG